MKRKFPAIAIAAACFLSACAGPADNKPAAASATPTSEIQWADPSAPDIFKFMATDLVSGEMIDGTTLLHKDVVMWFWASWCPICDAEAGALVNAMPDFPPGVTVLGVAGESSPDESKTFIANHAGVEAFPSIYDEDGHIWKDFDVVSQPTMVLLNQDGYSLTYSGGYGKFDIIDKVAWLGES